jgi:hypothetical protein
MSIATELEAAKAEVVRLEAELAVLPAEFTAKAESELSKLYADIASFFRGTVPPHQ